LKIEELLQLNIGSTTVKGNIIKVKEDKQKVKIKLKEPVCAEIGEKIAISRKIEDNMRLIGWGKIINGVKVDIE